MPNLLSVASRSLLPAIVLQVVLAYRQKDHFEKLSGDSLDASGSNPPDVLFGRESLFTEHTDVFGEAADANTWSTASIEQLERDSGIDPRDTENMTLFLTSDLFSTGATKPVLMETLRKILPDNKGLKAFWIHDARAGWNNFDMLKVWAMDTLAELKVFGELGIEQDFGLWINRWNEPDGRPMLSDNIGLSVLPGGKGKYREVDIATVKDRLDQSNVIYVPGGNPYTLMENMRSKEGKEIWAYALARIRKGQAIYISRSAGSIVAAADTDVSGDTKAADHDITGLDLLPMKLAIRPHYHAFYVLDKGHHDPAWRQEGSPKTEWTQNDMLLGMKEKGTRGVAVRDGEFLVFHKNKLTLMHGGLHGGSSSEDDLDDISEAFKGNDTVNDEVQLADGFTYRCCCGKDAAGTDVACKLKRSEFSIGIRKLAAQGLKHLPFAANRVKPCGKDAVEWHEVPTTEGMKELTNAGHCIVPSSEVPS